MHGAVAAMDVRAFDSLESLPEGYLKLLEQAGERSLFHGLLWYRALLETARDAGDRLRLYGVEAADSPDRPLALLIARTPAPGSSRLQGRSLLQFANFYSLDAGPVMASDLEDTEAVIRRLITAIAAERPRWDKVGFSNVRRPSPVYEALVSSLERCGMTVEAYFQNSNWYEPVNGRSFKAYISERGRGIKESVQRKARKLERERSVTWTMTTGREGLDEAIAAFQSVYAASWKEPEFYPDFIPRLIRACAEAGTLRLGNLSVDGVPAATQLTLLSGGSAIMYKTAYRPDYQQFSVGAVLLLYTVRHLLDHDGIEEIDFGIGDEPYKQEWATQRRESWSFIGYNRATLVGGAGAAAYLGRSLAKRFLGKAPATQD